MKLNIPPIDFLRTALPEIPEERWANIDITLRARESELREERDVESDWSESGGSSTHMGRSSTLNVDEESDWSLSRTDSNDKGKEKDLPVQAGPSRPATRVRHSTEVLANQAGSSRARESTAARGTMLSENERAFALFKHLDYVEPDDLKGAFFKFPKADNRLDMQIVGWTKKEPGRFHRGDKPIYYFVAADRNGTNEANVAIRAERLLEVMGPAGADLKPLSPDGEDINIVPVRELGIKRESVALLFAFGTSLNPITMRIVARHWRSGPFRRL